MRLPIQLRADLAGARAVQGAAHVALQRLAKLTFFAPDYEAFPALDIRKAGRRPQGRSAARCSTVQMKRPSVCSSTEGFGFTEIAERVSHSTGRASRTEKDITLDDVLAARQSSAQARSGAETADPERRQLCRYFQSFWPFWPSACWSSCMNSAILSPPSAAACQVNEFWIGMGPTILKHAVSRHDVLL